jgi:hypothetical protein
MIARATLAGTLLVAFLGHSHACTPIQFARGTSSATVNGTAQSTDASDTPISSCYTLATGRGQTATLKLVHGPKDDVAFPYGSRKHADVGP